jgi:hypothetical protein
MKGFTHHFVPPGNAGAKVHDNSDTATFHATHRELTNVRVWVFTLG